MRFKKKQPEKTDVIVGGATEKVAAPKEEQVYRGGTQTGLSKKPKIIIASVLIFLMVLSVSWLLVREVTKDAQPKAPNAAAVEGLKKELRNAKTPEAKADVYMKLSNETVQTSVTKSVTYAEQAVAETGSAKTYAQLGFAAEKAGETQKAITAYRKAAELSPKPSNPDENTDYTYYMSQANNLAGGGQ